MSVLDVLPLIYNKSLNKYSDAVNGVKTII